MKAENGERKTENGKGKACVSERNAKLVLVFHSKCSRGSSAQSAVKAAQLTFQFSVFTFHLSVFTFHLSVLFNQRCISATAA